MKHTELPWILKESYYGFGDIEISKVVDAKGDTIGITGFALSTRPEAPANTRLIVLAVNSHAALVSALEVMTTLVRIKYGNMDAEVYAEIEKAEQALKLAKGE